MPAGMPARSAFGVNHKLKRVGGGKKIFIVFQEEVGQSLVDLHKSILVGLGEKRAVADKILVGQLDGTHFVGLETQFVALVIEFLDALKQAGIHLHLVGSGRHERIDCFGKLLHLGSVVGLAERAKDSHDLREQFARLLHGKNGILKCRLGRIFGYSLDFTTLDFQALVDGRQIVGILYPVESRDFILSAVRLHKQVDPL